MADCDCCMKKEHETRTTQFAFTVYPEKRETITVLHRRVEQRPTI